MLFCPSLDDGYEGGGIGSVMPAAKAWEGFWEVCDAIDVWSWPPFLGDLTFYDGFVWNAEFAVGDRSVKIGAQLAGLPSTIEDDVMRLHKTLQQMIGWLPRCARR